jgi:hypothetical protein
MDPSYIIGVGCIHSGTALSDFVIRALIDERLHLFSDSVVQEYHLLPISFAYDREAAMRKLESISCHLHAYIMVVFGKSTFARRWEEDVLVRMRKYTCPLIVLFINFGNNPDSHDAFSVWPIEYEHMYLHTMSEPGVFVDVCSARRLWSLIDKFKRPANVLSKEQRLLLKKCPFDVAWLKRSE